MQVAREHNIKTRAEKSRGAGKRNSTKMQKSGTQTISRNSHTVQLAELRSNATIVRQTGGFLGDAHCTLHIAHTMGEQTNESALHAVANSTKTRFKQCNSHSTLFNKCSILRVESVKFHCARACVDVVLYVSHRHRHAYSAHFERRLKTEHNHCERILSSSLPSTARSCTHSLFSIRLRISVIQPHCTHIDREIRAKASPTSFHSHRTRKN